MVSKGKPSGARGLGVRQPLASHLVNSGAHEMAVGDESCRCPEVLPFLGPGCPCPLKAAPAGRLLPKASSFSRPFPALPYRPTQSQAASSSSKSAFLLLGVVRAGGQRS